jgi:hypothetical protein
LKTGSGLGRVGPESPRLGPGSGLSPSPANHYSDSPPVPRTPCTRCSFRRRPPIPHPHGPESRSCPPHHPFLIALLTLVFMPVRPSLSRHAPDARCAWVDRKTGMWRVRGTWWRRTRGILVRRREGGVGVRPATACLVRIRIIAPCIVCVT